MHSTPEIHRATLIARIAGRLLAAKIKRTMHAEKEADIVEACITAATKIVDRVAPRAITAEELSRRVVADHENPPLVLVKTELGPVPVPRMIADELEYLRKHISDARDALRPFAQMHQENPLLNPDAIVFALDAERKVIRSDFTRANRVLNEDHGL